MMVVVMMKVEKIIQYIGHGSRCTIQKYFSWIPHYPHRINQQWNRVRLVTFLFVQILKYDVLCLAAEVLCVFSPVLRISRELKRKEKEEEKEGKAREKAERAKAREAKKIMKEKVCSGQKSAHGKQKENKTGANVTFTDSELSKFSKAYKEG